MEAIEDFQLPAPDFTAITKMQPGFTKAALFAHKKLNTMTEPERIRACYQHACLCFAIGTLMTNATLRKRFGIEDHNAAKASRLIAEAVDAGLLKPANPKQGKKYASYLPFWA